MSAHSSPSLDSFKCRRSLNVGGESYDYFSLPEAEKNGLDGISKLPFSLKVLLENLLRFEDGTSVTADDIRACADWLKTKSSKHGIAYRPARVLMQDFTGVPAVVDLAAMRDALKTMGGDPTKINPLVPVDLVIDHSVMVDFFHTHANQPITLLGFVFTDDKFYKFHGHSIVRKKVHSQKLILMQN